MKLTYRPEIDGLRAIAVVAVILYHAKITISGHQPFQGGFIGVDIFFVISGYLITSIILKELVTTGTFSFKHFYERRIRRILPALLFVMLVSLPFAWMYLLPSSFIDFSKSILYSLGFSSNFYFHYSGQQYGAIDGWFKPFLHTWSLSVEEQYYILFPIVLLLTFKYFRKYLIHILIFGFIISLGLADWISKNNPSASFYFLHTRMWELLAGSILSFFEITKGHKSHNRTLNLILPTIGLILIGHSILFFNDDMFHPSLYTLSPIIGVSLIIWFSDKDEIITKILSTKLFVGVGLISYSLYLWHYPLFVFSKMINLSDGKIIIKILLIILLFALSFLTFNYIEKTFRNKKYNFKIIFNLIAVNFITLLFINFTFILNNGFKNRFPEILTKNQTINPWDLLVDDHGDICFGKSIQCRFGSNSDQKIYLIGDSHMASLSYSLKEKLVSNNYQLIASTNGIFCFEGFDIINLENNEIDKFCKNQFDTFRKNLPQEKKSIIIFSGRFPLYLNNSYFNNFEGGIENQKIKFKYLSKNNYNSLSVSFNKEVLRLSKNNKIIIVYPIPEVGWHVPPKLKEQILKDKKLLIKSNFSKEKFITTSFEVFKERTKSSFKLLDSIQGENIYRVYPHTLFCDTTIKYRCVTHDDKNIFYADDDHPSLKGAEMINDLILKEIKKIELKSN